MNPIETIKKGIINNDMQQVIKGFELLTGQEVSPEGPKTEESKKEEPKTDTKEIAQPPAPLRSKELDFSTSPREESGKYGKHEPIVVGENQFVDDGVEATDITTPDVERTTRRPPVKMVEVQCHACGEKEMINAQYKSGEFHRCGKCVGA